ncbi:protein FAM83H isoform X2 [Oryzias melastigma]|uniref:protein FAM83H isoform X2 n=1 Tax=Oryzias melastigma TaxID=30732 RepID=UPI000CF82318|nr:protein FAM83H isoform X2 [Oryzias melastigma]
MARRSQCSSAGENPLDPNYLPPHYREEYRLAIDALVEEDLEGYYQFLQRADVVDFLSTPEIQYIQSCVQVPHQGSHLEQHFLESGGDGSSDTYWPIHSDQDVPGLDLGWPQMNHFMGPTEVTTLINPPELDMPSIKDQARRLIKNAQQVIAIVMDTFTDVDILADILNAAMRNVAVYILLDEQSAHLFIQMVHNCRVNLQNFEFLRVRTVSGMTYQCRSGKSFKGQMLDRFLLTDCRAVLSGNYSYMWSFEKLHRCMAHLFLGQFVTTFDEEFRILFAQSQPLVIDMPAQMEDFSLSHKRQYPDEKALMYREPRKFLPGNIGQSDEWRRHSFEEREGDWKMIALKKQGSLRGPADTYGRFASQQPPMDPGFDQGPCRIPMVENQAYKRHSYAEGGQDRLFLPHQQRVPDFDLQGKPFPKGPHPYAGPEANYSNYDKFWNQDFQPTDQYCDPGLPQEVQLSDNFDPVLNYLSSTRNVDFDQSSDKLQTGLPFGSSQLKKPGFGQPYTCQTSPTPSNSAEQKLFLQEPSADRKDPAVKRGLRNWRISSYLSAYDSSGEEGLPLAPVQAPDPFEEPANPPQQTAPGTTLPTFKIPNIREFKVPAAPRTSQILNYGKTLEQPRKLLDVGAEAGEIRTSPTPSESSSTKEGEKTQEEQKETKSTAVRREESFRRNYNSALQRSSRLRSSLIFNSLDQHPTGEETSASEQQDEQKEKTETEQTKPPFVSQVLGQRRAGGRELFDWTRSLKSSCDASSSESSKPDEVSCKPDNKDPSNEENSKDPPANPEAQQSLKLTDVKQDNLSFPGPQSKPADVEPPKTEKPVPAKPSPAKPLFLDYLDMSDPDNRLLFFKELAAQRKAAQAAEAEKSKKKAELKPESSSSSEKRELPSVVISDTSIPEDLSQENAGSAGKTSIETCDSAPLPSEADEKTSKGDTVFKLGDRRETKASDDSQLGGSPSNLPLSLGTEPCKPSEETRGAFIKETSDLPRSADDTIAKLPSLHTEDSTETSSSSERSSVVTTSSGGDPLLSTVEVQKSESAQTSVYTPEPQAEPDLSNPPGLHNSPRTFSGSGLTPPPNLLPNTANPESVVSSPPESSFSAEESSQTSNILTKQTLPDVAYQSDMQLTFGSSHEESNTFPLETSTLSSQSTSNCEERSASSPEKDVSRSETAEPDLCSFQSTVKDVTEVLESPEFEKPGSTSPILSPSVGQQDRTGLLSCETSISRPDLKAAIIPETAAADAPPKPLPSHITLGTDPTPLSVSDTLPSPHDKPEQAAPPSDTNPTNSDAPTPAKAELPALESALTPETEKTETMSSSEEKLPVSLQCSESLIPPSVEPTSEPLTEGHLPCKAVEADSPESHTLQAPVPAESSLKEPELPETANVLSSSNLRDDTKLLLEQISANCQSRNEAVKESPVTDDEKEDGADKNAMRGTVYRRGQTKSPHEREKLLERIQSCRKERKVYSRFEMGP